MARKGAKISAKRAQKYDTRKEYTPEKKKDRRAAREKRRKKREEQREEKPQKPPKKSKKPQEPRQPQEPPRVEEPPLEIDYLIEQIWQKIDEIAGLQIPKYSNAVSAICSAGFSDFLQHIDKDNPEVASALASCLTDPVLNRSFYDSEQTEEAKQWADGLRSLANHLNSRQISDLAEAVAQYEDAEGAENVWEDLPTANNFFL